MKKLKIIAITVFSVTAIFSQSQYVLSQTNVNALALLESEFQNRDLVELQDAIDWSNQTGNPMVIEIGNGEQISLVGMRGGRLLYIGLENVNAAKTTMTDKIQPGGSTDLDLTGDGITAGIWDGGIVRETHAEFGDRVTNMDPNANYHCHSTHVAGTMIASGSNSNALGMASNALIKSWDYNSDTVEMADIAQSDPLLVSNHSYGFIAGWQNTINNGWMWFGDVALDTGEDHKFGFYDTSAEEYDQISFDAPYYLIVKSAGNDRNDSYSGWHWHWNSSIGNWEWDNDVHPHDGGTDGFDCISTTGNAKNILTVGAVEDIPNGYSVPTDVVLTDFSSFGPTDDGRIKPDLVANGQELFSPIAHTTYNGINSCNNCYDELSGTSMSAPNVSGTIILIQEHYQNTHNDLPLRADAMKGLLIHTADEAGDFDGPDYRHGWGLLNAQKAAELITQDNCNINQLTLDENNTHEFEVCSNGDPIRLTICWTDPAGTPPGTSVDPADIMLVNDLDLTLEKDGETFYPYLLNPSSPSSQPTTGDNDLDNVEQIFLSNPEPGYYTVKVEHEGSLINGSQNFALITSGVGECVVMRNLNHNDMDENLGGTLNLSESSTGLDTDVESLLKETIPVDVTLTYDARTNNPSLSSLNHFNWNNDESNYGVNWDNITFNEQLLDFGLNAMFDSKDQVTITTTQLVDLLLHDPWYLENPDADPDDWSQPDEFQPLSEQVDSSGNVQVFLNQGDINDPDSDLPIYSLKAPNFYTTPEGIIYEFTGWSATNGANFGNGEDVPTINNITDVVFINAEASVTANYQEAIPKNIPGEYSTIQQAIDNVDLRGLLLVQPGTYYENINFNGKAIILASLYLNDPLEDHIDATILDGSQNMCIDDNPYDECSVVTFNSGETDECQLIGFSITNGKGINLDPDGNSVFYYYGGGIACYDNSNPTLKNLKIYNNDRGDYGGGIYCEEYCNPIIENTIIYNNTAYDGAGLYCATNSSLMLTDVIIRGNQAADDGGGIYCRGYSNIVLDRVLITDNVAADDGGGIYFSNSLFSLNKCSISNNEALYGGALYLKNNSLGYVNNSILWDNTFYGVNEIEFHDTGQANLLDIKYTDIEGGIDNLIGDNGYVLEGAGVIDDDPSFVDPDNANVEERDYHLQWISSCINAGDPSSPSDPDGTDMDMGAYWFNYEPGDLNGDEDINVLDQVILVDWILNPIPETPTDNMLDIADLNDDGDIDILDVVALVAMINSPRLTENSNSNGGSALLYTTDNDDLNRSDGESIVITIESDVPVKGLQFDLSIDEGYEFVEMELMEASSGFELRYNEFDDGIIRTLVYPVDSFEVPPGVHDVLTLYFNDLARGSSTLDVSLIDPIVADDYGNNLLLGNSNNELPIAFALHAAYPNPFNPETTIKFDLPDETKVSLKIYNIMGQEVADLVNDNQLMQAGYHSIVWNASGYSSGIYFVKLSSPEYRKSQKLMLLK